MLDATKIGYLRSTPASTAPGSPASGPTKAMRNKLVKSGHISFEHGTYRRTEAGDQAIAAFDQSLSAAEIETVIPYSAVKGYVYPRQEALQALDGLS